MKHHRKITRLLQVLQAAAGMALMVLLARAMKTLYVLLKQEGAF